MTKLKLMAAVAAVMAGASVSHAQCSSGSLGTRDACQKTVDMINYITPQFATALTGGSATLGQGGTHAGLGHFALDLRATGVFGKFPKMNGTSYSTLGATASTIASSGKVVPMITAGASIGLFRGVSLGVTHIGGVDALISATYLPNVTVGDISVKATGGNMKFGFGVRIGLLEESLVAPGVAISILKRDLPTVTVTGTSQNGSYELKDYTVGSTAWRLSASKSFLLLNLYGGIGQDYYTSSSSVKVTVNSPGLAPSTSSNSMKMTRTNMFIGTSLNLFVIKITGELGQASGGSAPPSTNSFGGAANASRSYASLGVRFGL